MRVSRFWLIALLLVASFLIACSRNLLKAAQRDERAGNYEGALENYRAFLSRTPERDHHQRSAILMRMGECLYRMERFPEAFAAFKKASQTDRGNSTAHLRMGEMLLEAGLAEGARDEAMAVLQSRSSNNDALSLLGAAWAASDRPEMAKAVYRRVLRADPKQVKVAVALADIYNQENETEKASEVLERVAAAQPASALPWLALGRLEEEEGNGAPAEEAYRRAVATENTPETNYRLAQFLERSARITEAKQALRRVDAQRRQSPVALGDFELASGHPKQAVQRYQAATTEALRQDRPAKPVKAPALVTARLIEAEISAATKETGSARRATLSRVGKQVDGLSSWLDPATISILQAELALSANQLIEARSLASAATALAPNSASALYVSGLVEAAFGNRERARKEWERSLDQDAHFAPAHLALADAALKSGDAEQADEHARRVVRDDPGNFHAVMSFARALLMENQLPLAAIMAKRASALNPTSVAPSVVLGEVALQSDQFATALLIFERAVVEHPDSEAAMDGLLKVYHQGKISYAMLNNMQRMALRPPVSATLLEIVGRLYADHGWYAEAMRALQQALKVDPQRETAARSLAKLEWATGSRRQANRLVSRMSPAQQSLFRAYASESSGHWQKAINEYEQALREADRTGTAANNLAWLYAEHHLKLDRALELAKSAVKFSPDNPAVLDTLGCVQLRRREFSAAVTVLETAAQLSASKGNTPADRRLAEQIRDHLREAYLSVGNTDAALELAENRGPFALR